MVTINCILFALLWLYRYCVLFLYYSYLFRDFDLNLYLLFLFYLSKTLCRIFDVALPFACFCIISIYIFYEVEATYILFVHTQ